jgi:hypothetical protein
MNRYHQEMLETKIAWISKIETRDDALAVLNQGTLAFLFLGAFHIFPFLVRQNHVALVETTVVVVMALAVRQLHSRLAAMILFAVSCADAVGALASLFGVTYAAGSSLVMAGLMLWVAVRTTQATAALERMPDDDEDEVEAGLDR